MPETAAADTFLTGVLSDKRSKFKVLSLLL
jgi:hypothetical protein